MIKTNTLKNEHECDYKRKDGFTQYTTLGIPASLFHVFAWALLRSAVQGVFKVIGAVDRK